MNKLLSIVLLTSALSLHNIFSQEVGIQGNKFVQNNNEIWFNGINTPWHKFDDFGRNDFEPQWWADEFAKYKDNKINLARVWIHGSGEISPDIDATGHVSGANAKFWEHMDLLMDIAETNQIYVMPALLSFDITKSSYPTHQHWRNWLQSEANIQSYIDNVLIPMVKRYNNRPYLLAWEICNEPEWMFENTEHGPQSFYDVQKMHAMFAAAVHSNSTKYVTTGSAAPKWNSPIYDNWGEYEGNMFSDEALSSSINNTNAFLDFYQYHWYPWQSEWMKSPFTMTTAEYEVDDRPVIVGESEGNNVCDKYVCQTVTEMYENAYNNGFDGVCAWKTPQNDGHGTFENIAEATNAFYLNHPNLVYPDGFEPIPTTGVSISETNITITERESYNLVAKVQPLNATDKRVSWSSSNSLVATVSNGLVEGISAGQATITVKTTDGDYTASCSVEILPKGDSCSNPIAEILPFTHDGPGNNCIVITGTIDNINSWGMTLVEVNNINVTNEYANQLPEPVNGKYFIYYEGENNWSHIEIKGKDEPVEEYSLNVNIVGEGSVDPTGGNYTSGTSVSLTAKPNPGYEFSGWSGDASGSSLTTNVTMDANKTVTASFTQTSDTNEYILTVNIVGMGSVDPSGGIYKESTVVNLTATADAGYEFSGWSEDASGSSLTTSVTMDANKSVTATFQKSGGEPCESPEIASLPLSQDGVGEYCWFTTEGIDYVNSWNMAVVEINGVNFTNNWSNSMPATVDGGYYIYYKGNYSWSHLEITKSKATEAIISSNETLVYPNPFSEFINIKIDNPDLVNSIIISDKMGRKVEILDKSQITSFFTLGLNYNQGIYVVKVNTANEVQTFLIKKINKLTKPLCIQNL